MEALPISCAAKLPLPIENEYAWQLKSEFRRHGSVSNIIIADITGVAVRINKMAAVPGGSSVWWPSKRLMALGQCMI